MSQRSLVAFAITSALVIGLLVVWGVVTVFARHGGEQRYMGELLGVQPNVKRWVNGIKWYLDGHACWASEDEQLDFLADLYSHPAMSPMRATQERLTIFEAIYINPDCDEWESSKANERAGGIAAVAYVSSRYGSEPIVIMTQFDLYQYAGKVGSFDKHSVAVPIWADRATGTAVVLPEGPFSNEE